MGRCRCVYSYSAIGNSNVNNPSHTNGNNDGVASSASDHNASIGIMVATLTSMARGTTGEDSVTKPTKTTSQSKFQHKLHFTLHRFLLISVCRKRIRNNNWGNFNRFHRKSTIYHHCNKFFFYQIHLDELAGSRQPGLLPTLTTPLALFTQWNINTKSTCVFLTRRAATRPKKNTSPY